MEGIIHLQLWQMIAAYIFIVILLFIVKIKGISRERDILISTTRMTIQLILTGYILVYIFDHSHPCIPCNRHSISDCHYARNCW
ncbi:Uncharacterised protein family (UPF0014) [Anaerovirgula multivorans]|uniref:Uncharacterized protein family (UPF0014) n=1 Tax=Anaerovirgula multivorans TaxID=312168 RepID=A0A239AHS9_9FIRM|nr:ABC transporter permease [Anaerovirgula multivorans]SNR94931.1 Uncharacterised protein family (UPF0014) [Anaerovirgula multivorans]